MSPFFRSPCHAVSRSATGLLLGASLIWPLAAAAGHGGADHDHAHDEGRRPGHAASHGEAARVPSHEGHAARLPAARPSSHAVRGAMVVEGGHTFAPRPGVPNLGVYFDQVRNAGDKPDQLLSAAFPMAERVELHEMKMEGDVMRMRETPAIDIPPGGSVDMRRGASLHVMVIGLKQPLKAGDHFDLKLHFRKAGEQTVRIEVRDAAQAGTRHHGGEHGHAAGQGAGHAGH